MAKLSEVTVDVSARLTVTDETANRCLRMLEMWQADNPAKRIICEERYGTVCFHIEQWKPETTMTFTQPHHEQEDKPDA